MFLETYDGLLVDYHPFEMLTTPKRETIGYLRQTLELEGKVQDEKV